MATRNSHHCGSSSLTHLQPQVCTNRSSLASNTTTKVHILHRTHRTFIPWSLLPIPLTFNTTKGNQCSTLLCRMRISNVSSIKGLQKSIKYLMTRKRQFRIFKQETKPAIGTMKTQAKSSASSCQKTKRCCTKENSKRTKTTASTQITSTQLFATSATWRARSSSPSSSPMTRTARRTSCRSICADSLTSPRVTRQKI